jgi:spore germination protein KB
VESSNKIRISRLQLVMLMIGFMFVSRVLLNPAASAKKDAWMALILAWAGGIILITMYTEIARRNTGKSLVGILTANFGKVLGAILALMYCGYFTYMASLILLNFGQFMVITVFPETPLSVILALFALAVVYPVRCGLEVVGRLAELLVPFMVIPTLMLGLALVTSHDFTAFLPMFENGIVPVVKSAFSVMSFPYGETVIFLMIFLYVNKKENIRKDCYLAFSIAGFLFLFASFRDLFALGPDLLGRSVYSPNISAKLIPGISIEPLVVVNLLVGAIKACIAIFAASEIILQLLKIDKKKPIIIIITEFSIVMAMWLFTNFFEYTRWVEQVWTLVCIPFEIIIPVMLLIISMTKQRKNV